MGASPAGIHRGSGPLPPGARPPPLPPDNESRMLMRVSRHFRSFSAAILARAGSGPLCLPRAAAGSAPPARPGTRAAPGRQLRAPPPPARGAGGAPALAAEESPSQGFSHLEKLSLGDSGNCSHYKLPVLLDVHLQMLGSNLISADQHLPWIEVASCQKMPISILRIGGIKDDLDEN
ncbi:uncharacterized protein RG961_009656 [Leptosomus discolor]